MSHRFKAGPQSGRPRRRLARIVRQLRRNPGLVVLAETNRHTLTTFLSVVTRAVAAEIAPAAAPIRSPFLCPGRPQYVATLF